MRRAHELKNIYMMCTDKSCTINNATFLKKIDFQFKSLGNRQKREAKMKFSTDRLSYWHGTNPTLHFWISDNFVVANWIDGLSPRCADRWFGLWRDVCLCTCMCIWEEQNVEPSTGSVHTVQVKIWSADV